MVSICRRCEKLIRFASVVMSLLLVESAQSGGVTLSMDADVIEWEATLAYHSAPLANETHAHMLSRSMDWISLSSPVFAQDIDWPITLFENVEETLVPHPEDNFPFRQIDGGFTGIFVSSQYLLFDFSLPTEQWDHFTHDFESVSMDNTLSMPAAMFLICLGLVGLTGFARRRTSP